MHPRKITKDLGSYDEPCRTRHERRASRDGMLAGRKRLIVCRRLNAYRLFL